MTDDATYVREARLRLGLSQEEFGKAIGYRGKHVRKQIWDIENERAVLMPLRRKRIERLLSKGLELGPHGA